MNMTSRGYCSRTTDGTETKETVECVERALSATPNPYLVRLKNREISGFILRLTLGVSLPFGLPYAVLSVR